MNNKTDLKQLTLRMPENLHRNFKANTARHGVSMGEVAIELIKKYLKKESDTL